MKPKEKMIKCIVLLFITSTYANSEQIANDRIDTLDLPLSDDSEVHQIHNGEDQMLSEGKSVNVHILLSTTDLMDGRLNSTQIRSGKIIPKLERSEQRNNARGKIREVYLEFPKFGDRKSDLTRSSNLEKHIRSMLRGNRNGKQKYARISVYVSELKPFKTNPIQIPVRNYQARVSLTRQKRMENSNQPEIESLKVLDLKPTIVFRTSMQRSVSAVRNMPQKDIERNMRHSRFWRRQTKLTGDRKQNSMAQANNDHQKGSRIDSRDARIRSLSKERLWDSEKFIPDTLRRVTHERQVTTLKPLDNVTFNRKIVLGRRKRDLPRKQLDARMRNERNNVRGESELNRNRKTNENAERKFTYSQQYNTQKKLIREISQKNSEENVRLSEKEEFVHKNQRNVNGRRMVYKTDLKSVHSRVRDKDNAYDSRMTRNNRFIKNTRQVEYLNEREKKLIRDISQKNSEENVRLSEKEEFVHKNQRNVNGRRMVYKTDLKTVHSRVRDNDNDNAYDSRITRNNRFIKNTRQVEYLNEREKKLIRDISQKNSEENVRLSEKEEFVHKNQRNVNGRRMVYKTDLKTVHSRVRDNDNDNAYDSRITRNNRFIKNTRQVEYLNEREGRILNSVSRDLKWKLNGVKPNNVAERSSLKTNRKSSERGKAEHVQDQVRDTRTLKERNNRDSAKVSERQSAKKEKYSGINRQEKENIRTLESSMKEQVRDSLRIKTSRTIKREGTINQESTPNTRMNTESRKITRRNINVVNSLRNSNQFQREHRDARDNLGIRRTEKPMEAEVRERSYNTRIRAISQKLENERKNTIVMNSYRRFQRNYNSPERKLPEKVRLLPSVNNRLHEIRKERIDKGTHIDMQRNTDRKYNRVLLTEKLRQENVSRRMSVKGRIESTRLYHAVDPTERQTVSIAMRRDRYTEFHGQRNVLDERVINRSNNKFKGIVRMDNERESVRNFRHNERRYAEINDRQNTIRNIKMDNNKYLSVRNVRLEGYENVIEVRQQVISRNRRERKGGEGRESELHHRISESSTREIFIFKAKVASEEYRKQETTRIVRNRNQTQRKDEKENRQSEKRNRLLPMMKLRTRLRDIYVIRSIQSAERSIQDTQKRNGRGFRGKNYQRIISEENGMRSTRVLNKRFASRVVEQISNRVEKSSEENDKLHAKARLNQQLEEKRISQKNKRSSLLVEKLTQTSRSRARAVEDRRERTAISKRNSRGFREKKSDRVMSVDTSVIQVRQHQPLIINSKLIDAKTSNRLGRNALTIKKQNGPVEQRNGRGLRGKLARRKLGIFKFYSQLPEKSLESALFANTNNLRLSMFLELSKFSRTLTHFGEKTNLQRNMGGKTSVRNKWRNVRNVITTVTLPYDGSRINYQTKVSPEERMCTRDITKHRALTRELTESRITQTIYHIGLQSAQREQHTRSSLRSDHRLNRRINDNIYFDNFDNYRKRYSFTSFREQKSRNTYDGIRIRLQKSLQILPLINRQALRRTVDASRNFGLRIEMKAIRNIYNAESRMVSRQAKYYDSRLSSTTVPENVMYSALKSDSIPGRNIMEKQLTISPQVFDSRTDDTSSRGHWKISGKSAASFLFDLILGLLILATSAKSGMKAKPIREKICDIFLLRSNIF